MSVKNIAMSYIQQPISRHLSGNTEMAGKTTMIPQTSLAYMQIPMQQQYDIARQSYFRHHALAPRTVQASIGMRGNTDNGNRFEVRGDPRAYTGSFSDLTFGTPNVKRSMPENIYNTKVANAKVQRQSHLYRQFTDPSPSLSGGAMTRSQAARQEELDREASCKIAGYELQNCVKAKRGRKPKSAGKGNRGGKFRG